MKSTINTTKEISCCSRLQSRETATSLGHKSDNNCAGNPIAIPARMCDKILAFYQHWISPLFAPCCIYCPTCSQYARIAYNRFGVMRGSYLTIRRLLRCHPLHKGGFDPVPDEFSFFKHKDRKAQKTEKVSASMFAREETGAFHVRRHMEG